MTSTALSTTDAHLRAVCGRFDTTELSKALQHCINAVDTAAKEPALFSMRCRHHQRTSTSLTVKLRFVDALLLAGLAMRISPSVLQQTLLGAMIYADISFQRGNKASPSRHALKQWLSALKAPSLGVAYNTLLILCRRGKAPNKIFVWNSKTDPLTALLSVAWLHAEQHRSLHAIITEVVDSEPQCLPWINSLISFENAFWSGRVVRQNTLLYFVLGCRNSQLLLISTHDQQMSAISSAQFAECELIDKSVSFSRWYQAYIVDKRDNQAQQCLCQKQSYPIQTPPASLLAVLNAINHPDAEPQAIAKLVEANPLFVDVLRSSAEQLNRLNLKVDNVLQSILTHGLERIGAVLTEQALWHRLTLSRFPLSNQFRRLGELHRTTAAGLAHLTQHPFPQSMSLLATFHLSALFTYAPLRNRCLWQIPAQQPEKAETLFNSAIAVPFAAYASALAKAWQQPPSILTPLAHMNAHSNTTPSREQQILSAALALSRAWLRGSDITLQALKHLLPDNNCFEQITQRDLDQLRNDTSSFVICDLAQMA